MPPLLRHPSAGSLYLNFYYDLGSITPEELQYLNLLTDVLDELDTPAHTAQQLNTLRSTWLGDSRAQLDLWTGRQEGSPCHAKLSLCLSLLERSPEKAVEIGGEWLYDTVLTGAAAEAAYARVVSQLKLRMEQLFIQQGNEFASTRARAHYYVEGAADEACTGVSYYHFLCGLLEKADWAALGAKLNAVRRRVLQTAALTVSLHGSEDALEKLRTLLPESRFAAARRTPAQPHTQPLTPPVNEAFIIDGGVNYDVLAWPMPRDSRRRVLARVMSYEYLWHTIREVGGAYGTGMLCADGIEFLYTYRDPPPAGKLRYLCRRPCRPCRPGLHRPGSGRVHRRHRRQAGHAPQGACRCPGAGSPVLLRHHGRDAHRRPQGAVQRGRRPAQSAGRCPV